MSVDVCVREKARRLHIKTEMVIGTGNQKRKEVELGWLKRILSIAFYFFKENWSIYCIILKRRTHREKFRKYIFANSKYDKMPIYPAWLENGCAILFVLFFCKYTFPKKKREKKMKSRTQ